MVLSPRPSTCSSSQTQAELDLLETVLFGDDVTYPWNPGECEALDETVALGEPLKVDDLNLGDRSPVFFEQLDSCMVYASLCERFGSQVPTSILKRLCDLAKQTRPEQSPLERLVACVADVLPQWPREDLQVLARPLACAMRGQSRTERLSDRPWQELSSLEKARLSLAIAQVTLHEFSVDSNP
ncbi:MAG: hypothetical protein JJU32_12800 [Phormidium sp. BM_Day4_Bin.17]|nr:hypothetical protein [Phormidium sp. BM_Day4_Bin.17]UCJ11807.1 MAG: hypothetical protein JWS08_19065 [Phormidium sp. PBR-2020]